MIPLFLFAFIFTGVFVRVLTPPLHFRNKTPTYFIRKKTKRDIHHFHIGILILMLNLVLLFFIPLGKTFTILLGISLSLIADQFFQSLGFVDYFSLKGITYSFLAHIIFGLFGSLFLLLINRII